MVLLSGLAMYPATSRHPRHAPASSSSSSPSSSEPLDPSLALGPFAHTNGYFYSPSHSEDGPSYSGNRGRKKGVFHGPQEATAASSVTSSVTSKGVYSSLTHLDEWSPSTVSLSSLLRHSCDAHGRNSGSTSSSRNNNNNNNIVHVNGGDDGASLSRMTPGGFLSVSTNYSSSTMPRRSSRDKSLPLRRTVSAEPHNHRDQDPYVAVPGSGSTPQSPVGGSLPRVPSEEDVCESEYVTLDYAYRAVSADRDSVRSKLTDVSSSSSTTSDNGNYRQFYSDESNYYYANGYGSDSGRGGSPFTGSLQRSGTLPVGSSLKKRTMSEERLWTQPRAGSMMERGKGSLKGSLKGSVKGSVPRKKSSQTLQTVTENTVPSPPPAAAAMASPVKSILKNGSNNNNNDGSGSGTNTPRSTTSSRRSSITSRQDSVSSEPCPSRGPPSLGPHPSLTPLHGILVKHKHLSHTFGGSPSPADLAFPPPLSHRLRLKSKSLSDLRQDVTDSVEGASGCYSDDEDGDDFGFLSHTFHGGVLVSRAAMHKGKATATTATTTTAAGGGGGGGGGTSSPSHRLLPRRWRNKGKSGTATGSGSTAHPAQVMWSPEGPCTWCSVSGRKVILKPVSILQLSEAERLALQKLAVTKLQSMNLACPIVIPKDSSDLRRQKKRALSLKRRSKSANLASLLDTLSSDKGKDKDNKDVKPAGLVFGIPLSRCIANDRELAKRRAKGPSTSSTLPGRSDSSDQLLSPRRGRKSSSSSQGSLDNGAHNGTMTTTGPCSIYDSARRAASSDSLSESDHSSRNTSSNLIEALSLHATPGERGESQAVGSTPQVPRIVDACFKHLETHGLHVLGIFRVGSSKKRVKQLREEFDSGKEVLLTDEHNPHDVGALLKEFFRDLPEPLLTRDLYLPFVATRKIKDREAQAEAVRLLLTLLPAANRDTLWALLRFLSSVHSQSNDGVDSNGREVAGNKMDSHNLATLFGPNILHRARAVNEKQFMAECAEQAEQSSEVIGVVKDMIDNHYDLFEISANQRDEVLKLMLEADHENLDRVLRRLSNENQIEPDPESTCSVFETEGELTQSLPHSANSDADLLQLLARKKGLTHPHGQHQPLRVSRSADPWTDPPQRANPSHPFQEGRRVSSLDSASERLSHSPSPQDSPGGPFSPRTVSGTGSLPRPPVVTVSKDSSEVVMRPSSTGRRGGQEGVPGARSRPLSAHFAGRERPYSEAYAGGLNIPKPAYMRENSGASSASCSSYLSSSGGQASDSSGHWVLPTPPVSRGASPQTQRRSTATGTRPQPQQGTRRRGLQTSSSRSDDDDGCGPAVGSPEWQRERWRHWEEITAGRNGGGAGDIEQETLV